MKTLTCPICGREVHEEIGDRLTLVYVPSRQWFVLEHQTQRQWRDGQMHYNQWCAWAGHWVVENGDFVRKDS